MTASLSAQAADWPTRLPAGRKGKLRQGGRWDSPAGIADVTPHRLRHTLATRLLNAGMDVTRIQKLLGHEHLNTTMIYARVFDATVEADYRRAMAQMERQQMPLSPTPELADGWPTGQPVNRLPVLADGTLDNSV